MLGLGILLLRICAKKKIKNMDKDLCIKIQYNEKLKIYICDYINYGISM